MNFYQAGMLRSKTHWLKNYEIPENNQFLRRVEEGVRVEDLRLKLGIVLKESGEFIKKIFSRLPLWGL